MNNEFNEYLRYAFSLMGAIIAAIEPTLPYIIICTVAILWDCLTAWQLGRRVRKAYPEQAKMNAEKFLSKHFCKVIETLIKSYLLIVLAFMIHKYITGGLGVDMTKVAAGAICFWQLWSILENESSCNGAKWAKVMQKILVDKTSRHLDIDLSELEANKNESTN